MKKVIVFLADGTEEIEALTPVDMLRRAGAQVTLAGVPEMECTCSHGVKITADTEARDCVCGEYDMVVLPGGMPGTLNLQASAKVNEFIDRAYDKGAFIGATCAAPSILGEKGLLKGKMAVCYPGFEDKLLGATVFQAGVICDGNIITANAAGAAVDFAAQLIAALKGESAADAVLEAVHA